MVRIAITGGIACGKSLVAAHLVEQGVPVCEADAVGHDVLASDKAVYDAIVERFGGAVLAEDGRIERAKLGRVVFTDPACLADLNRVTHPEIMARIGVWVSRQEAQEVAVVIPLLYEIGDEANWDRVVCVASPAADQLQRLLDRGLTEEEARQRIACQWPQERKMERADCVIYNCGSRELLFRQVDEVVRTIRGA